MLAERCAQSPKKQAQKRVTNAKAQSQDLPANSCTSDTWNNRRHARSQDLPAHGVAEEPLKPGKKKSEKGRFRSQEAASTGSPSTSKGNNKKSTYCMFHLQGVCLHTSDKCPYAHSMEEIIAAQKNSQIGSASCETVDQNIGSVRPVEGRTAASSAGGRCPPQSFDAPVFPPVHPPPIFDALLPPPMGFSSAPTHAANPYLDPSSAWGFGPEAWAWGFGAHTGAYPPWLEHPMLPSGLPPLQPEQPPLPLEQPLMPPAAVARQNLAGAPGLSVLQTEQSSVPFEQSLLPPPPGLEPKDSTDMASQPMYINTSNLCGTQPPSVGESGADVGLASGTERIQEDSTDREQLLGLLRQLRTELLASRAP